MDNVVSVENRSEQAVIIKLVSDDGLVSEFSVSARHS